MSTTLEDLYEALKNEVDIDLVLSGALELLAYDWKNQLMGYLVSKFSFFAWPIVNPVVGFVISTILRMAIKYTEMGAYFWFVDEITKDEADELIKAKIRLKEIQKNGTKEEIAKAEREAIDRARDLIKMGGLFNAPRIP